MILAMIIKSKQNDYYSIECKGHSGYSETGSDIICAAVSMLVINTINAIDVFTKNVCCEQENSEKHGWLKITIEDKLSCDTLLLLDTLILGLRNIQKEYGNDYINIVYKEV